MSIKVFISYAQEDIEKVRGLYVLLCLAGYEPWVDREDLLPGRNWKVAIHQEIEQADFIIICLSTNSVAKSGFVQKELALAVEAASMRPKNQIFLLPVKLESCEIPFDLKGYNFVELYEPRGIAKLLAAIETGRKERNLFTKAEMASHKLLHWLVEHGRDVKTEAGGVMFTYKGTEMTCLFDARANRMRIISLPMETGHLDLELGRRLLEVNFRDSQDGRYCTHNGNIYVAFLHPLNDLSEAQLLRGLECCKGLVESFGTDFRSDVSVSVLPECGDTKATTKEQIGNWLDTGYRPENKATDDIIIERAGIQLRCSFEEMDVFAITGEIKQSAKKDDIKSMLDANFHTALDPRYAINNSKPVVSFRHGVSEMTESILDSAINQTFALIKTYCESFSSTVWEFSGMQDRQ